MKINLIGNIGEEVSSYRMQYLLDEANGEDLEVYVSSMGGQVLEAVAIRGMLKNYKGKKKAVVVGVAASAMTGILSAFDEVAMDKDAWFMIHNVRGTVSGTPEEIESYLTTAKAFNDQLVNHYHEKTGLPEKEIRQYMDEEKWFTAKEAKKLNFVDKLVDLSDKSYTMQVTEISESKDFLRLVADANVPENVSASVRRLILTQTEMPMKYDSLLNLSGEVNEDARHKAVQALVNKATELESKLNGKDKDLSDMVAKVGQLTNELTNLKAEAEKARATSTLVELMNGKGVSLSDAHKESALRRLNLINTVTDEAVKKDLSDDLDKFILENGVKFGSEFEGTEQRESNRDLSYEQKVAKELENQAKLHPEKDFNFHYTMAKEIVNAQINGGK